MGHIRPLDNFFRIYGKKSFLHNIENDSILRKLVLESFESISHQSAELFNAVQCEYRVCIGKWYRKPPMIFTSTLIEYWMKKLTDILWQSHEFYRSQRKSCYREWLRPLQGFYKIGLREEKLTNNKSPCRIKFVKVHLTLTMLTTSTDQRAKDHFQVPIFHLIG